MAPSSARGQAILDQIGSPHSQGIVETLVTHAERVLHQDILNGVHPPGARLNIRALSEQYDIGATPLREALTKLSATGFVTIVENRGFRVARLSRDDLLDIVTARQLIEVAALRESMREGGAEWEAGIVAALQKIDHFARRSSPDNPDWGDALDTVHKEFHTALLMAAGSGRLIAVHQMLYDQTFRYRQAMFTALPSMEEFVEDHRGLAALVLARDIEAACARLTHHLTHTLRSVYPDNAQA
jgi:DNA-binding GntR family transcriptional regulator